MTSHPFGSQDIELRVVILEEVDEASVEIFELPKPVEIGTEFERQGKVWRITANRPRSRVLLAQLLNRTCLV
ncbi:MAG: hypothetical protein K8R59_13605, partial [Thermoanaerobaculales bacterium]|nr:hypothetical protein [Thermoanaerobaculales bacterium]MCD4750402.1 hypothetical protein [Thermoanaerobaculales bacterium]